MAHFAQIVDDFVVRVMEVSDDALGDDGTSDDAGIALCQSVFGPDTRWVRTSLTGEIRRFYAGIGYRYDANADEFVLPGWEWDGTSWIDPEQTQTNSPTV